MDDCTTCPSADGPSRRSLLNQTEDIIDEETWLKNWSESMCEMAGDCPGPECEACKERMAERVMSSPGGVVASAPAGRVASVLSSVLGR